MMTWSTQWSQLLPALQWLLDTFAWRRDVLAEPLGQTVFFAGEATHPAINPCIQAAIETGQQAAAQVLAARSDKAESRL